MPTVLFFNKLGARSTGYAPKKLGSRPDTQPSHALSRYVNGSGGNPGRETPAPAGGHPRRGPLLRAARPAGGDAVRDAVPEASLTATGFESDRVRSGRGDGIDQV